MLHCWKSASHQKKYVIVCIALLPLVVFFSFSKPWGLSMDFWDTAAAVRELSIHPLQPSHHLYVLPGQASARFHPYTLFWGLFKRTTGLGIFPTMGLAGIVNYLIFMVGLYFFVSDKFKSRSLPILTFLTMLWVWGYGYSQANAYHLEMFLVTLPYVGFFAFALSLNALYFLNRFCAGNKGRDLSLYAILSIVAFVTHPITGLFCYAASFALLVECRKWRKLIVLQSIPLLAMGSSLLWPYFSYWDLFTKNAVTSSFPSPLFQNQIPALGPALLGFPVVLFYGLRKKHSFILYGLSLSLFIYILSFFGNVPIGSRFILFAAFFIHLALAIYIQDIGLFDLQKMRDSLRSDGLLIIVFIVIIIFPGVLRVREMAGFLLFDKPIRIHGYQSPIKPYLFLSRHLSAGDVVLSSNWRAGFPLPAITGARIVEPRHLHSLLMSEEADGRKKDALSFFQDPLSREGRISLLKKYRITHILIDLKDEASWHPSFREGLAAIAGEVAREGTIILYKILSSLSRLPLDCSGSASSRVILGMGAANDQLPSAAATIEGSAFPRCSSRTPALAGARTV